MDIPTNITIKAKWDDIEAKLHPATKSDSIKVFALRSMFYAGASHMLTIILEAADLCESNEDQEEYLASLREEIQQNAVGELAKLGVTDEIMETILWETEQRLAKQR